MHPETPGTRKSNAPVPSERIDEKLLEQARVLKLQNLTTADVTAATNMMNIFKESFKASSKTKAAYKLVKKMLEKVEGICALQNLLVNVVAATRSLLEKQPKLNNDMRLLIHKMLNASAGLLGSFCNELSVNESVISKQKGLQQGLVERKIVKQAIQDSVSGSDAMLQTTICSPNSAIPLQINECLKNLQCSEPKKPTTKPKRFSMKELVAKAGQTAAPAAKKRKVEPKRREKISQNVVASAFKPATVTQSSVDREELLKERQRLLKLWPYQALLFDLIKDKNLYRPNFKEISKTFGLDNYATALLKGEANPEQYIPEHLRNTYQMQDKI